MRTLQDVRKVCHFHAHRQASTIRARISQAPSESWASAYILQLWETGLLNQNLGPGYRVSNKGWPDLHGKKKYLSLVLIAVSLKSYFLSARVYQLKYSPVISCFLAVFFPLYRDTFAWSRSLSPKSALDEIFFFFFIRKLIFLHLFLRLLNPILRWITQFLEKCLIWKPGGWFFFLPGRSIKAIWAYTSNRWGRCLLDRRVLPRLNQPATSSIALPHPGFWAPSLYPWHILLLCSLSLSFSSSKS